MTNYVNCTIIIIGTVFKQKTGGIMTSLELSKVFEVEFNKTLESQETQIRQKFEELIDHIRNNISSYISKYDDDFFIDGSICLPFICLDAVKEWAYVYFEEMDNIVVQSILTGHSYSRETEITKIELRIFL